MVKILIYEDSESDTRSRYAYLTKEHDVHVRCFPESPLVGFQRDKLEKAGFKPENIREGHKGVGEERADIYFVDGLDGDCIHLLSQLPKERTFLNTDDKNLEERAEEQGFQILRVSPKDTIARLMGY